MKIKLNALEQRLAKALGREHNKNNIQRNVKEQIQSARDPEEISIEGSAGELVACKYFDVYMDLKTDGNPADYPDYDLITRGGIKVDVKTSDWDWQNPQFKEAMWSTRMNARKQNADVDAYLFVKGKMPVYEVCGWQYKKEHLQQKKMNERTGQEYYYCMESQLRPMAEQYQQFGQ